MYNNGSLKKKGVVVNVQVPRVTETKSSRTCPDFVHIKPFSRRSIRTTHRYRFLTTLYILYGVKKLLFLSDLPIPIS